MTSLYYRWIKPFQNQLLTIAGILTLLTIVIIKWNGMISSSQHTDFIAAKRYFSKWTETQDHSLLTSLQNVLKKQPQLHPVYDGGIAACLLQRNEHALGCYFAELALKRQPEAIQEVAQFTRISLLIAEEKYQEALAASTQLSKRLSSKEYPLLQLFNLARIAFIHQKLGQRQEEQIAWQTLHKTPHKEAFNLLMSQFSVEKIPLALYLKEREKLLSQAR